MRPIGTQTELEKRRRQAVKLLKTCGVRETARKVYASPSSVVRWRNAFEQKGYEGLDSKKAPSRPCRLTNKQLQKLQGVLLKQVRADKGQTRKINLGKIAKIIRKHFGVHYQPSSIWYLLSKLGWKHKKIKGKSYWILKN